MDTYPKSVSDNYRPMFDDIDPALALEHAEKTRGTEPLMLGFSHRDAFIVNFGWMPVGQINWRMLQDKSAFSDDDATADAAWGDHNGYYLEIDTLAVDEAFRGRGVATLLMERFVRLAEAVHGERGWKPGAFTADGAAFWKATHGEIVPVTQRISFY